MNLLFFCCFLYDFMPISVWKLSVDTLGDEQKDSSSARKNSKSKDGHELELTQATLLALLRRLRRLTSGCNISISVVDGLSFRERFRLKIQIHKFRCGISVFTFDSWYKGWENDQLNRKLAHQLAQPLLTVCISGKECSFCLQKETEERYQLFCNFAILYSKNMFQRFQCFNSFASLCLEALSFRLAVWCLPGSRLGKIDLTIMTLHLNTSTEEYIDVPKKKHQKHKMFYKYIFDTWFWVGSTFWEKQTWTKH